MEEQKEPKIYVDIGVVDMNDLTSDDVPDDFWNRLGWYTEYNRREDLEIRISKDNEAALDRIHGSERIYLQDKNRGLADKGDHLSVRTKHFDCFGNYEDCITDRMIELLQPEGDDKYLLETINICVYMQKDSNDKKADVLSHLLPLDIKQFSAYTDIVGTILECAKKHDFDGFHCGYDIFGYDRCSLCLFIEDSEDRWDGLRYQINFHISFYQMPGVSNGPVAGKEIQDIKDKESYTLDCIIASGDKCDSFDDFRKWADAFFFGYRVD